MQPKHQIQHHGASSTSKYFLLFQSVLPIWYSTWECSVFCKLLHNLQLKKKMLLESCLQEFRTWFMEKHFKKKKKNEQTKENLHCWTLKQLMTASITEGIRYSLRDTTRYYYSCIDMQLCVCPLWWHNPMPNLSTKVTWPSIPPSLIGLFSPHQTLGPNTSI